MFHTRRHHLKQMLAGSVGLSMAGLTGQTLEASTVQTQFTHHTPKAKRVIFLFMHGGPSHVDLFDYKPELQKRDGGELPFETPSNIDAKRVLMKSPWSFKQYGECGQWVSELLPHTAKKVDDLSLILSMHSKGQSHGQAVSMLHTGSDNLVRPSLGAWVSYGLGTENGNLPSFVSIGPSSGHGGPRNYGSAFLPAEHQATTIGRQGKIGNAKIEHLVADSKAPQRDERRLSLIQSLNQSHLDRLGPDKRISGMIEAYDLASRMQRSAPEVLDLSKESPETQDLYGIGTKETDNFGRQCLLGRRLLEAGVRFVELSTGNVWDQHGGLKAGHERNALATDQPIAGLLTDLESRGLLDDTLVVWTGEFGRTPTVQGSNGRDHNPQGFCSWLAGGGVKSGFSFGQTDDFGYHAAVDRVHMHDLHATILHLLGINHEELTYRFAGRDFRLTDVAGRVVDEIIA
ncbi:DUF1501 domain-containing protein [Thalassoglobus polymorphus]|uniref:Sulfatase n=1 Tax=Thalassoglobus polymorphus TaxID=2527994 RepID=A0A517QRY0_9PLAN|nr:DUF1501 domain-containing protein [Thalassoglobus polymorphus]QDT34372.1 hypothetical protein Mal48_36320 [Thalassoglobus polymorphus]